MLASQYILFGLILIILIKTIQTTLKKKIPLGFAILWLFIWIAGMVMALDPNLLTSIAKLLKIGRGVDLAVYTSVILIFYLIYQLLIRIIELEKKITLVVRSKALKENIE